MSRAHRIESKFKNTQQQHLFPAPATLDEWLSKGEIYCRNKRGNFLLKRQKLWKRFSWFVYLLDCWSCISFSWTLDRTRIVDFVPHLYHLPKLVGKGSLNGQYQQEDWLLFCMHWSIQAENSTNTRTAGTTVITPARNTAAASTINSNTGTFSTCTGTIMIMTLCMTHLFEDSVLKCFTIKQGQENIDER